MYNNIDTDHAIQVISWWLDELEPELPNSFPMEAVKYAMKIIMRNNIFEWGNLYFLQLLGTAMGTSAAVMWATLYYGYHEVHTLIPKYGQYLLYFKRFIDDIKGIWLMPAENGMEKWTEFCNDINDFGILTWDISELSKSVDFLDLTITINNGRIETKTYQKAMNLYLYLPPASAHPQSCIKGTVYGLIRRYYVQNTHRKDYIHFVVLLYRRLLERGWERDFIYNLIIEVTNKIESRSAQQSTTTDESEEDEARLFIHLQYHPNDIPRKMIRQLYNEHCGELFKSEMNINRATVAYSRPRNIGEFITQAKLHQAPGKLASDFMGEYKQGLDP